MSFQPISFIEPVNHINLAPIMNTSMISAALNGVSPNAKQMPAAPDAEVDDAKPRFSDIMKDQRAPGKGAVDATNNGTHVKTGRSKTSDEEKSASDTADAPALLAGSSSPTLPELAMSIAAQAASSPLAKDSHTEHAAKQSASSAALDANAASTDHPLAAPAIAQVGATGQHLAAPAVIAPAASTNQLPAAQAATAPAASSVHAMLASPDNIAPPKPVAVPAPANSADQDTRKADTDNELTETRRTGHGTETSPTLKTGNVASDQASATMVPNALALPVHRADGTNDAPTQIVAPAISSIGSLVDSSMLTATTAASQGNMQMTSLGIGTPLQNAQWSNDFARQLTTLAGNGATHTAELSLNPPDLGPLRISISVSDNVAQAVFMSPHAAVRQAVENALPQLQQTLANAGISLGQASVSDQSNRQDAFDQVQPVKRKLSASAIAGIGSAGNGPPVHSTQRSKALEGLVDTFA